HAGAVPERSPLDLVHRRHHARAIDQLFDLVDGVVADTDVTRETGALRAPQSRPERLADAVLGRPMNQDQVRVLEPELRQVLARGIVCAGALLDLRDHVDGFARDPGPAQRAADAALGVVVAGRV